MCFFAVPVGAAENKTLHVYSDDYPPYNYHKDGRASGISTDILVKMFEVAGMPYTRSDIYLLPWKRAYDSALTVPHTLLFSMTRTPDREKQFKWVGPIIETSVGLMARKDSEVVIISEKDIEKYRIGMIKNDVGELQLLNRGLNSEKFEYSSNVRSNIRKLHHRRIDLFSFDEAVAKFVVKDSGLNVDDFEIVYTLTHGELYYALHVDTPDSTVEKLQKALNSLKIVDENGSSFVEQVIRNYQ